MEKQPMRGVFPILVMPFDEDGQIDEASLCSLVEFCIAAGVHGLGVALGSEVFKLSEAERAQVTRVVVRQARGRVPVVINTSGAGNELAVLYSQAAEQNGADAVMAIPPSMTPAGMEDLRDYFRAISRSVHIPVFIQDTGAAPVSASLARQIAEECPQVRYIKVESMPVLERVAGMVKIAGDRLTVFGGAGGNYFVEELRRGSQGTMPFCSQPEAFVEVWNAFQKGDQAGARETFYRNILPVNRLAEQGSGIYYTVHKEILRRRGVIRTAKVRSPAPPVDEVTFQELQNLIDELYPTN